MLWVRPTTNIALAIIVGVAIAGCGGGSQSLVPDSLTGQQTAATSSITPSESGGDDDASVADVWPMEVAVAETPSDTRAITSAPKLTAPPNGAEVDKTQGVVFKWTSVPKATRYMISISQSPNFSTHYALLSDSKGSATQKTIPKIPPNQPSGQYYWRVRASDNSRARPKDDSKWGPYSSTGTFTLTGGANPCGTDTTGTVKGTVTDVTTNATISGATVELDTAQTATTDSTGNYAIANVPIGLRTGVVKKSGYLSSAIEANVTPGACVTVNVKLQPTGGSGPPPPPIFP